MLKEEIRSIYEGLYEVFKDDLLSENNGSRVGRLAPFVPIAGKYYSAQMPIRLFLAGRAVNGWESVPADNAEKFGLAALEALDTDGFAEWLDCDEKGRLFSRHTEKESPRYYLDSSPFWRAARTVWSELFGREPHGRWLDNIVWSNLYKIAPQAGGNPSNKVCRAQVELCRCLLKEEIETFAPSHILLVTGWNWFCDPSGTYDFAELFTEVVRLGKNQRGNGTFVEGTACFQIPGGEKIPVVIACRPEGRNEKDYVADVIRQFSRLSASES